MATARPPRAESAPVAPSAAAKPGPWTVRTEISGKRVAKALAWIFGVPLAILVVAALWGGFVRMRATPGASDGLFAVTHAPMSVADATESVAAHSTKTLDATLPYAGTFALEVAVVRGNGMDIDVRVDGVALPEFHAKKAKSFRKSARAPAGSCSIVLHDGTLGIISASSSDVRVVANLSP